MSFRGRERRFTLLVALIAVCVAALAVAGCGSDDGDTTGGTSGTSTSGGDGGSDLEFAVLSVGTQSDGSFGQSWYEATENANETTEGTGKFVGNLNNPDEYFSQGSSFAEAGYELILLAHGGMAPVAIKLAEKFPDTQICVAPVTEAQEGQPDNLCVIDVQQEVGAFRSGLLAGLMTTDNVVASNQSLPIPPITRQIVAFKLGAECVNPDVKVLHATTNNDTDPAVTKTASEDQVSRGADVLMGATGTAMPGMFQAAQEVPDTYAIGQYVDSSGVAPEVVIASNIANFQEVLGLVVERQINGEIPKKWFHSYGIDSPVEVGYLAYNQALYDELPGEVRDANDAVQEEYTDGTITLPGTAELVAAGEGGAPITVDSLGCDPQKAQAAVSG